ncbi:glycosyltransferase [Edaphobacter aggregans]|uniref:glycosyltransferase n=1 Tax=Edaphobacter aggregans TaxID=570835 RepID=UPI0006914EE6|nr:glycosyltransferase [Edaphobacter aggregans]
MTEAESEVLRTERGTNPEESVAVVITTFNDTKYLLDALHSVFAQTRPADEVIVVDDGSEVTPAPLLEAFPIVKLIEKANGGVASARNVGLLQATSRFICFLDADDRLRPNALAAGLACFQTHPETALVYGGHYQIGRDGLPKGNTNVPMPTGTDPYSTLLTGNMIGMIATALFRRDRLMELGGYDERLRRGEDYELYLRVAPRYPIASHSQVVAEYRWHGDNISKDTAQMLEAILSIHDKHRPDGGHRLDFWLQGRRNWYDWYKHGQEAMWGDGASNAAKSVLAAPRAHVLLKRIFRAAVPERLRALRRRTWPPRVGKVDFGSLASTRPLSMDFGWERGTPLDRYYIEGFLQEHSRDIKGRVLEIGDDLYSRRFGTEIAQLDVLHVSSENLKVTITGDITTRGVLPEGAFDCIIFTQTLQLIYDLNEAVERLHAALKPGGVLLLTVPGISQIDRHEWGTNWCWSFTVSSLHRLFERVFGRGELQFSTHGNVFAAICFLTGAVVEDVDISDLDVHDPAYPVNITLRAQRAR